MTDSCFDQCFEKLSRNQNNNFLSCRLNIALMLILFKSIIFSCTHKCLSWQMLQLEPLFSFFNLYYGLCITVKALIFNHFWFNMKQEFLDLSGLCSKTYEIKKRALRLPCCSRTKINHHLISNWAQLEHSIIDGFLTERQQRPVESKEAPMTSSRGNKPTTNLSTCPCIIRTIFV